MKRTLLIAVCALTLATGVTPALAGAEKNDLAHAPEAENLQIETYRNTSVGGTLRAVDPEGEAVTFTLSTEPMKGTVELNADGTFVYTPNENKKGKDYFGYKATDTEGNTSQEATVIIRIKKQKTDVVYDDMNGRAEGRDAVLLAEKGVFVGQCVAGHWLFDPERAVDRDEFLAMCLAAQGEPTLQGVMTTGFGDDEAIEVWAKSYVSTARMHGAVTGYSDGKRMVFDAGRPITHAEAAVVLNRMLQPEEVSFTTSEAVPAWAEQAVANLTDCGLFAADLRIGEPLTRAECAGMLAAVMEQMD